MRKVLFGLTAAATLAFAFPGAGLARDDGGHGGRGGGAHISGGGGGHVSGHASGRSMGARNFSAHGGVSARSNIRSGDVHRGGRHAHWNRGVSSRGYAAVNSRENRTAWNHGRHHRHHRYGGYWYSPGFYYDDYAGYDTCYRYVWTRYGYRYVDTCSSIYFGVY